METKEITRKEFMEQVDYYKMAKDIWEMRVRINNDRNISPRYKKEYDDVTQALSVAETTLNALRSLVFTVDISAGEKFSVKEDIYCGYKGV